MDAKKLNIANANYPGKTKILYLTSGSVDVAAAARAYLDDLEANAEQYAAAAAAREADAAREALGPAEVARVAAAHAAAAGDGGGALGMAGVVAALKALSGAAPPREAVAALLAARADGGAPGARRDGVDDLGAFLALLAGADEALFKPPPELDADAIFQRAMDARLARKRAEAAAAAAAEPPLSPEDSFAQRSSASASSVSESGRLAGSDSNSDAFDTPGKRSASENSWVM